MKPLENKIALVTGAARGIGRAIAVQLAADGADVALCDVKADWLEETAAAVRDLGRRAECYAMDVADGAAVGAAVARAAADFGRLDILVNNAGITRDGLIMRMKDEAWDEVLAVNLTSVFLTCRRLSRLMANQRKGSIINISSVVGIMGNGGQTNYAASKAGIIGFSKSLARELASRSVRVNVVAPGFISTSMTDVLGEQTKEQIKTQIPLGRIGNAEEVARSVAFLASENASYITGQVLAVDGGMSM